ncbi:aminoglycoside phosphotransferase family protein [Vulgatibacter incomptus]|uniref:Putative phosphotransferase related to Ser/Thr protein kinase n=1 Tax=Vulgatibacter incomptus TaxID=1391653 RepID=A0A0K1PEA4_9BACT|nr:phosphotransferase [Vulgatibacter incomptus]AKU91827.1 putative phosphotransferase related to Ser/Thr protein kinase [Vulgatibacter incomptus]
MSDVSPELLRRHAALAAGLVADPSWPVIRLKQDASNRSYFRVALPDRSFVLMAMPAGAGSEEATKGEAPSELPFVNVHRYLGRLGVRVPAIHRYEPEAGIMVLEDLGDVTFEAGLAQGGDPASRREALYGQAVDLLASLRARADRNPDPACLASTRAFDFDLYRWELDHFLEWGLAELHGVALDPASKSIVERHADTIAHALAALPRGFTHRDYQSRNLMVLPGDELAVIDFQDALQGPRQYDLVALLRDSYVELPIELVERMVRRYLVRLAEEGGPVLEPEAFLADFHLLTVQRKLKDAGRFVFIDRVKKNPSFLPYVAPSLRYVKEALARRPELAELDEILGRHVPELARPAA